MKIRAVTAFVPLTWPIDEGTIAAVGRFLRLTRQALTDAGYEVQTLRLATSPFLDIVADPEPASHLAFAQALESLAGQHSIEYVSIGPVITTTPLGFLSPIRTLPDVIRETERVFTAVLVASANTGLNLAAIRATAAAIHEIAHTTERGLGNLRLAMLANVQPGSPFFPAAFHVGSGVAFGLATEAADLAVEAFGRARTLDEARRNLVASIEDHAGRLGAVCDRLVDEHQIHFNGIDFSPAPFPSQGRSIAEALEHLGLDAFGGNGTLFASAFLTDCLRRATFPRAGFSGLMLPVLEDATLGQRAAEGQYTVLDLLLYSAVCGTGLDTVPLPGEATPEEIAALLLDVATLAVKLNKPLTARLMPIPGKSAGEMTDFDFEYFVNARILPLKRSGAESLFQFNSFVDFASG